MTQIQVKEFKNRWPGRAPASAIDLDSLAIGADRQIGFLIRKGAKHLAKKFPSPLQGSPAFLSEVYSHGFRLLSRLFPETTILHNPSILIVSSMTGLRFHGSTTKKGAGFSDPSEKYWLCSDPWGLSYWSIREIVTSPNISMSSSTSLKKV